MSLPKVNDIKTYTGNTKKDFHNAIIRLAKEQVNFLKDFFSDVFTKEQCMVKLEMCQAIKINSYARGVSDNTMYEIKGTFMDITFTGYITLTKTFISPYVTFDGVAPNGEYKSYAVDTVFNNILNSY